MRHRAGGETCFAPLLRWVLRWWRGHDLPLALDATTLGTPLVVLSLSVLYRGTATPVAWAIFPDRDQGPWMPTLTRLLALLAPVVPRALFVVLMTDCGLWSPTLWRQILAQGWHPVRRIRPDATVAPAGQQRRPARTLLPGPGHAWVGAGVADKDPAKQQAATLLVVWDEGQDEPWLLLTDLAPEAVEGSWYGLRIWIALGLRTLKSCGWDWERTRRTDPARVARHWLVLAVATLVALAYGTRVEDAVRLGVPPANLRTARTPPPALRPRRSSLFARGRLWLGGHLWQGRLWRHLWLRPEPWPEPSPGLQITIYQPPPDLAHA